MSGTISDRVALFVPGRPSSEQAWMEALGRVGLRVEGGVLRGEPLDSSVQIEWVANAGGFGDAFSFGNVRREVVQVVDACAFALVLRFSVDLREGRREIGELVTRLREAGAVGVRLEQSKLGWEISDWLALMTSDDAWSWHRATIVVLNGEGALQSCGMHAFSLPDVRIETAGGDPDVLQELASVFNAYQLAEAPLLLSGQTFSPDPDTPRRVLERWPDIDYPLNHVCHNPYGVWRLGPPGERGRPQSKLAPTFMLHSWPHCWRWRRRQASRSPGSKSRQHETNIRASRWSSGTHNGWSVRGALDLSVRNWPR